MKKEARKSREAGLGQKKRGGGEEGTNWGFRAQRTLEGGLGK